MNRTEFIITITIILIIAFALGWFANWLAHRLTRVSDADVNQLESLAASLHEAEELRDQAITYIEQRESELTTQLSQTEAELRAAMEGLREARSENDHLRSKLEKS
ncbi:MAG: hypothetical protein O2824_03215 [Proteobacteria bacterium]|nr:hypothetical protein [Rhodobacterales bacterium LSUCC0374]MBF9039825.1 hypothetical protein [Rhodobacterales bacterium LSUCC0387]MDA0901155.1 hypothetical protein [Pseudomonadota bacterium]